jgi:hydroxypyruvate isomerase
MTRLSANLGFLWLELPLLERIEAAARAGFRAIELHYPYDHDPRDVAATCAAHGVKLLGINTPLGSRPEDRGLAAVPGREDEGRALIDQAFDFAIAAGGTAVHVMPGIVPPEQRDAARDAFIAALGYAAERAEAANLTILLEALNPRDMPGYFYSRQAEAAAIIAAVGSSRIRLQFDCYHVGMVEGDVLGDLRRQWPLVGHVQFAAVPSRAEPDEGEVDYSAVLHELGTLGYTGWIGCEYRPRTTTDAGLDWMQRLGSAPTV